MDGLWDFLLAGVAVAGVLGLVVLVAAILLLRMLWKRGRALAARQAPRLERARTEIAAFTKGTGPQREAVELRRRLAAAVSATDRQFATAQYQPLISALVADQHRELQRLAADLDAHLKTLQNEPDPRVVEAALPEATDWTDQLCGVAGELRSAVRDSATLTTDGDVKALGHAAGDGAAALRAGIDYLQAQVHRAPVIRERS